MLFSASEYELLWYGSAYFEKGQSERYYFAYAAGRRVHLQHITAAQLMW